MTIVQLILSLVLFVAGLSIGAIMAWLVAHNRLLTKSEQLKVQLAQLQEARAADIEKVQWVQQAQTQMREAFVALASQTLQSNSQEFLRQTKAELGYMVDPLKGNLTALDEQIRSLEQKREGAYQGLQEQLRQLAQTHSSLQNTTLTLSQALKSPTIRGRWGEMQLRRIVEMAGMANHVDFIEQVSVDGGRPDMISHLPNGGVLAVDSKVPLSSYLEAFEVNEEQARKAKLALHTKALKDRIRELAQKKYWEQFDHTPEFVVMFVPNEACLSAAFEIEPDLLEYAIKQRVLITTPVTLLALLKTVAYGWQQYQITENSRQIVEQGRELYRRLATFTEHLSELRKGLNRSVEAYNKALGSFENRLLPAIRRFEDMGVAGSEIAPPLLIETQARSLAD